MEAHEFQTHGAESPTKLAWGFIQLDDLRSAPPARVRCYVDDDNVAGVSIFGADATDAANENTLVYIRMFRLPAADAAFIKDLQLFGDVKTASPPIDPATLAPTTVPPTWRHRAIGSIADGGEIVHAWRGGHHALLIRYLRQSGDVLNDPLFNWTANNLTIVRGAWRLDPPGVAPADDADASTAVETHHRPLDKTEMEQLAANAMRARNSLQLSAAVSDEQILAALHAAVEQVRPSFASLKPNVQHNMTVSLGSLWGVLLCNATPWRWCELLRGEAEEGFLAIVSPDASYAISPVDFFTALLTQAPENADNTVRLLFNMIVAGQLPPSRPGEYKMLR